MDLHNLSTTQALDVPYCSLEPSEEPYLSFAVSFTINKHCRLKLHFLKSLAVSWPHNRFISVHKIHIFLLPIHRYSGPYKGILKAAKHRLNHLAELEGL